MREMRKKKHTAIRRIFSLLICTALLTGTFSLTFSQASVAAQAGDSMAEGGVFGYFHFDQTTQTITRYSQSPDAPKDVVVPAKINGVEVLHIGNNAFQGYNITSLAFEADNKVQDIGISAFENCASLAAVTLPDSVTSIGASAFKSCSSLTGITLPEELASIGKQAFYQSGLTSVTVPDSVTTIGEEVFRNCSSLTTAVLSNGMNSVPNSTFFGCSKLEDVTLPDSAGSIGDMVFQNCSSLADISIPNTVTSVGKQAFFQSGLTSITIPDSVTTMGTNVFSSCSNLASVTLSENLASIPDSAFSSCGKLQTISIPASVTSIGSSAFSYSGLTSITIPATVTTMEASVFQNCNSLTDVTILNGLTAIPRSAFQYCYNLQTVSIPDSVTSIGQYAFGNCGKVTSITLPDSLATIGNYAFYTCTGLTEIRIPESVTKIGTGAFRGCSKLESIHIEEKDKNPASGAPWDADNAVVYWRNTKTIDGKYVYEQDEDGIIITKYLGKEAVSVNIADDFAKAGITGAITRLDPYAFYAKEVTGVEMPHTVTSMGENVFSGCSNLAHVTLSDKLEAIPDYAFASCSSLHNVTIPGSVKTVGDRAFHNCRGDGFTEIKLPDSVTSIGQYAFASCRNVTSVTLSGTLTSIGAYAFQYCSGLPEITIPASVNTIGIYAFQSCSSLEFIRIPSKGKDGISGSPWASPKAAVLWKGTEIVNKKYVYVYDEAAGTGIITRYIGTDGLADIPADFEAYGNETNRTLPVTGIDTNAFKDNTTLKSVTIPGSVQSIADDSFNGCTSLAAVHLSEGLETIGSFAFQKCSALKAITIPKSVTSIDGYAFYQCTGLESVILQEGLNTINSYAFQSCSALKEITIPDSVTVIGTPSQNSYAFADCTSLAKVKLSENLKTIPSHTFDNCTSLTAITIPDSVTSIGSSAFSGCTQLETVRLPAELVTLGNNAFTNTALKGTLELPLSLKNMYKETFSGVTTLDELVIPYARKPCPYSGAHPYGILNEDKPTKITYGGGTPTITSNLRSAGNQQYYLDFTITFRGADGILRDQVTSVILPDTDGSAGTSRIDVGGADSWSTRQTGNTMTVTQAGNYLIQVAGLDGNLHTYSVTVGDPVMTVQDISFYTGDLPEITEEQLLYALKLVNANAESLVKDDFGATCDVSISPEDVAKVKQLANGESITITVHAAHSFNGGPGVDHELTVTAESLTVSGTVVWDDMDNASGFRPGECTVNLYDNTSIGSPAEIDSQPVQPDAGGNWSFHFDNLSPWAAVDAGGKVGVLHIGDRISYSAEGAEVNRYTAKTTSNAANEYTVTYTVKPLAPMTNADTGACSWAFVAAAVTAFAAYAFVCRRKRGNKA
jgi:hypothetical protein